MHSVLTGVTNDSGTDRRFKTFALGSPPGYAPMALRSVRTYRKRDIILTFSNVPALSIPPELFGSKTNASQSSTHPESISSLEYA